MIIYLDLMDETEIGMVIRPYEIKNGKIQTSSEKLDVQKIHSSFLLSCLIKGFTTAFISEFMKDRDSISLMNDIVALKESFLEVDTELNKRYPSFKYICNLLTLDSLR